MIHHSASNQPAPGDEDDFTRQIEQYGESRDGAAVEYHYLIYPTGVCHGGFGDTRGCHSAQTDPAAGVNYNSTAIGVCFVGYFHPPNNHDVSPAAVATFQSWLDWMIGSGRLTGDVVIPAPRNGAAGWYGHRDVFATACPGDRLYPRLPDIVQLPADSGAPPAAAPDEQERYRGMGDFVVVYDMDGEGVPSGTVLEIVHGAKRHVAGEEWYQVIKGVVMDRDGHVPAHAVWQPVAQVTNGWYALALPDYDTATGLAVPTLAAPP
jgi:hypothetical protein